MADRSPASKTRPIVPTRVSPAPASSAGFTTSLEFGAEQSAEWNAYVCAHEQGTFFHTWAWRNAVGDVFPHRAFYLAATRRGRITGVLPMFEVNSRFSGRMLVSVPYGVGGGIIADSEQTAGSLFEAARGIARRRGCTSIDLRSARASVARIPIVNRYVGFRRELPTSAEEVLGWLPRKARAAARNAREKHKLTISFDDAHLKSVWRLYSISMRRLGSITYPFSFFERLIAHTPGRHWVSLVSWRGRPVAGLVTFLFNDTVLPYFIGTTNEARRCSAANFIYLTAMERGVAAGYRVFDFGRSRKDNTGSYDFKRFNGFTPRPLEYQCYTLPGHTAPNLSPSNPKFDLARRVWRFLPLSVTRVLSARLANHIPG